MHWDGKNESAVKYPLNNVLLYELFYFSIACAFSVLFAIYLQHSFLFDAQFYSDHSTHSIFTGHTTRSPGFSSTTTKIIPKWVMAKDQLHSEHKRYIHYTVFSFPFETTVDVWDLVCIHHFRRI